MKIIFKYLRIILKIQKENSLGKKLFDPKIFDLYFDIAFCYFRKKRTSSLSSTRTHSEEELRMKRRNT